MEEAHELLTAANFLTLTDCVRWVVTKVVASMTAVRAHARARAQIAHLLTWRFFAGDGRAVAAAGAGGDAGRG